VSAGTISLPPFVGLIVNAAPEHIVLLFGPITGVGLTVMVKVSTGPKHETVPLVNVGVTVIAAVMGSLVELSARKLGISVTLPELDAAKPMEMLSFVQV
jgi:hypothetical protein